MNKRRTMANIIKNLILQFIISVLLRGFVTIRGGVFITGVSRKEGKVSERRKGVSAFASFAYFALFA